jgi:hypothetical protein
VRGVFEHFDERFYTFLHNAMTDPEGDDAGVCAPVSATESSGHPPGHDRGPQPARPLVAG